MTALTHPHERVGDALEDLPTRGQLQPALPEDVQQHQPQPLLHAHGGVLAERDQLGLGGLEVDGPVARVRARDQVLLQVAQVHEPARADLVHALLAQRDMLAELVHQRRVARVVLERGGHVLGGLVRAARALLLLPLGELVVRLERPQVAREVDGRDVRVAVARPELVLRVVDDQSALVHLLLRGLLRQRLGVEGDHLAAHAGHVAGQRLVRELVHERCHGVQRPVHDQDLALGARLPHACDLLGVAELGVQRASDDLAGAGAALVADGRLVQHGKEEGDQLATGEDELGVEGLARRGPHERGHAVGAAQREHALLQRREVHVKLRQALQPLGDGGALDAVDELIGHRAREEDVRGLILDWVSAEVAQHQVHRRFGRIQEVDGREGRHGLALARDVLHGDDARVDNLVGAEARGDHTRGVLVQDEDHTRLVASVDDHVVQQACAARARRSERRGKEIRG